MRGKAIKPFLKILVKQRQYPLKEVNDVLAIGYYCVDNQHKIIVSYDEMISYPIDLYDVIVSAWGEEVDV